MRWARQQRIMLKVETCGGKVRVAGNGLQLLKAKTIVAKYLEGASIASVRKDCFEIDLATYLRARSSLAGMVEEDQAASSDVEMERASVASHLESREKIFELQKVGSPRTCIPHWDALLDRHQVIAASAISTEGLRGLCLFDEQGTGKTVSAIAGFDLLRRKGAVDVAVIVGPKTLMKNWADEIDKFLPAPNETILIEGTSDEKYRKLSKSCIAYLVTYETLGTQVELFKLLSTRKKIFLIVDESFNVKNPDAIRSKALRDFRATAQKCIVLCGTPAPNAPVDLVHQFDLADKGVTFGDRKLPEDKERQREYIKGLMDARGIYLRRVKEDVLPNLPEKKFRVLPVDMTPRQASLYREAKNELVIYLKTLDNKQFKKSLATYFQKRAVLLQLCSDPRLVDPLFNEDSAKFLALDEILKQEIDHKGRKVIVWAAYKRTINDLLVRYSRYNPVRIDGEVSSAEERHENVRKFQTDPSVKLFVGNAAAAGAGITLHSSSLAIYFSWSNQAAHYMQSIDRIHRRGQEADEVSYEFIVSNNTIETIEMQRLLKKQQTQSDLMGDEGHDISSLEEALRELGD